MAQVNVPLGGSQDITTSETADVTLGVASTLNIIGTAQAPITVSLSSLAAASVLNTITITYANVLVQGPASASAITAFKIGNGGTLTFQNAAGVTAGTSIQFTGTTGNLVFGNGISVPLLNGITGFGPGKTIDLSNTVATSLTYTDGAGTNTGGVIKLLDANNQQVATVTLNSGEFVTSSFHLQSDGNGGSLIDFNAVATSVTAAPHDATLGLGKTAVFTVTTNKPVTVAGSPTLLLNDGGVATYSAALSQGNQLAFVYTASAGQTSSDLTVTGVATNGAVMTAADGSGFDFATAIGNPSGILAVDTTSPTVLSVAADTPNAVLSAGNSVVLSVNTSEPVIVDTTNGTPTLTLNDGGTATYDAGSSTATRLVFRHTVASGQNAADLSVTAANLNGAAITDVGGNALNFSAAAGNLAGTLVVDTTPPHATTFTATASSTTVGPVGVVTVTVGLSEPINISGGPLSLTLNDGGTATFDAAQSTSTSLVFTHTVAAGNNSPDLAITGLALNGATATDAAGNPLDLSSFVNNPPGILTVDTVPPVVTGISSNPSSGTLVAGQTIGFTVALSEALKPGGGTPTLTLSDGGTASFDAANSSATQLAFTHTIQPGQNVASLSVSSVSVSGAPLTDNAGNPLDLTTLVGDRIGTLAVDTTNPVVTTLSTNPSNGSFGANQIISITASLSKGVTLTGGAPVLTLSDGGTAVYDANQSSPTSLVFTYSVQPGHNTADLTVIGVSANGATATDSTGHVLNLGSLVGNPTGVLVIDTTAPTVTGVTVDPASGVLGANQTVAITVALSEPVRLSNGSPILLLSDGGTATLDTADSSPTSLVFQHTVQPGQTAADLTIVGVNPNGAMTTDLAGNALDLNGLISDPAGTLQIDGQAPTVSGVTTNPGSGVLGANQTVAITVALSEPVRLSNGSPILLLSDGGTATLDTADSSPTSLVFQHTVQPGQTAADLTIVGVNPNGAMATDLAGNALDLNGLIGDPAGVLQIDGQVPAVTGVTTNPGSGTLGVGQTVEIDVAINKALVLDGSSMPTLRLSDGGTAILDTAASTPNMLVFTHSVQAGQNTSDLQVIGVTPSGTPLTDAAGNVLNLAGAIINPTGILAVDTTPLTTTPPTTIPSGPTQPTTPAPSVTSVTTTPGSGSLVPGQSFDVDVTTDMPVSVVNGVPVLALSDGGFATYDPTRSTSTTLVFTSVVQPGDLADVLAVVGFDLKGASIADANGQSLSLTAAEVTPPGHLSIVAPPATTPPTNPSQPPVTTPPVDTTPVTPVGTDPVTPVGTDPVTPVGSDPIQVGGVTSGTDPAPSDPSGNGDITGTTPTQTSTPSTLNVYRFFDSRNGTHFYTTSDAERNSILSSRPDLVPEGQDGVGLRAVNPASGDPAAVEVFRFFDTIHGTQFLTASTTERDGLLANRPDLKFEPQGSFFEHTQPQPNDTPVYRFFSSTDGTHFYTDNAAERANILQTRPDLIAEGIGFYEPH